jgi:hypothetical protein
MSTNAFSLAPEPISGDSLTQYLRSMTNSLGAAGSQTFGQGQNILAQGLQGLKAPMSYYSDILSGNKAEMESAIAPEKSDILSQYRARRKQLAAGQRGGGTNEAVAESEFKQAGDVAALLQKLRPQAAAGEAQIAREVAGLGIQESHMGDEQLFQALGGLLARRGQNVSQDMSNWSNLTSGLESVLSFFSFD